MKNNQKKKGFTLIELIVVIAILGILAAVAVPRFSGMQSAARVKADGATASSIVNAAKVEEADINTSPIVLLSDGKTALDATGGDPSLYIDTKYMTIPSPTSAASGGKFNIAYNASKLYVVTWTSVANGYADTQTYTEGTAFVPKTK